MALKKLGKYELIEELGRGGYGTVYRAREVVLDVGRAVKVLHPALVSDPEFIERFRREARITAQLEHPNIVPVYELDEVGGAYFLVMRYLAGGSLKQLLGKEGRLTFGRAVEITRQVAAALDFAHSHKINLIHRDVKPGNILFEADGKTVRLSDFGFAKALSGASSASLSVTGGMIGTPAYMAPEVWRGQTVSPATDVYSLGCVFYEMITGEVLFQGDSPPEIMTKHVLDGPKFPEQWGDDVPGNIENVLFLALAKETNDRNVSPEAFLDYMIGIGCSPRTNSLPINGYAQKKNLYKPKKVLFAKFIASLKHGLFHVIDQIHMITSSITLKGDDRFTQVRKFTKWILIILFISFFIVFFLIRVSSIPFTIYPSLNATKTLQATGTQFLTNTPDIHGSVTRTSIAQRKVTVQANATNVQDNSEIVTTLARATAQVRATNRVYETKTAIAQEVPPTKTARALLQETNFARISSTLEQKEIQLAQKETQKGTTTAIAKLTETAGPNATATAFAKFDNFDFNRFYWSTSSGANEYWKGSKFIENGKFIWKVEEAFQNFVSWTTPQGISEKSDFKLTVDVFLKSGQTDSACYGFWFRGNGKDYYIFEVCENEKIFRVKLHSSDLGWETLLEMPGEKATKTGQVNKITIDAVGSFMNFYINDQFVGSVDDDRYLSGHIGLLVRLDKGDSATYEFDNFTLTKP
jgi:serine/threonine protein kinase